MQCKHCYTHMQLVRRENHQNSFLEWYQCPVCIRMELISEPVQYRCDSTSEGADNTEQATHPGT